MRKYIIGWILNVFVTFGAFFCSCLAIGLIIGMIYGMTGNKDIPTEEQFANNGLFGLFCFMSLLGSNFFGYYLTVKKYIVNQ